MRKLQISGYNKKFRGELFKSAKMASEKMLFNDQNGIRPLFRNRKQIEEDKKVRSKSKWWNKKGRKYTTILFVPPTPQGELAKLIQKREEELNRYSELSVKVVEKGGVRLKNMLIKKDPFQKSKCSTDLCPICHETEFSVPDEKNGIPCGTQNVGYRWICTKCQSTYEGESARQNTVRAIEHLKDLQKNRRNSPLMKHLRVHHPEGDAKFKFKTTKKFYDALSRQADEAVRINKANSAQLINSKSEFNSAPIGRVKLDKPWKLRRD